MDVNQNAVVKLTLTLLKVIYQFFLPLINMDFSNLNLLMGSSPIGLCKMCCTDTCRCKKNKKSPRAITPKYKSKPKSKSKSKSHSKGKAKGGKPKPKHFMLESQVVPTQPPNVNPPPPFLPPHGLFTDNQPPPQGLFTGNGGNQLAKPMYSQYVNQYDMYNNMPPPPPPRPSGGGGDSPRVNKWFEHVDDWYNDLRLWHNTVDVMTKCNGQQRRLIHELERRQAHMLNGMHEERLPKPVVKVSPKMRGRPLSRGRLHSRGRPHPTMVENCTYKCVKTPQHPPGTPRPRPKPVVLPPHLPRPTHINPILLPPHRRPIRPLPPPHTMRPPPPPHTMRPPPPPQTMRPPPPQTMRPLPPQTVRPIPPIRPIPPPHTVRPRPPLKGNGRSPPLKKRTPQLRYIKEGFSLDLDVDNTSTINLNIIWAILIFLLIVGLIIGLKSN